MESDVPGLLEWFTKQKLDPDTGKVVVKPVKAGSSLGVAIAYGINDSIKRANDIIMKGIDDKVLVEIFLGGREFTAIVIDVGGVLKSRPICLLPTEVELQFHDEGRMRDDGIFSYRRKYLPTQQVAYHTPPRFPLHVIEHIRQGASRLFRLFGLRDFARIDGWLLPSSSPILPSNNTKFGFTESGCIVYTDINLVSGMEQTSFLFQQASKVGFSHMNILQTVIKHACLRFSPPRKLLKSNLGQLHTSSRSSFHNCIPRKSIGRQKVFVIFGGEASERQVSLMSGTNVWLSLRSFDHLEVIPCLLAPRSICTGPKDLNGDKDDSFRTIWTLPYSLVLRHTVEEVLAACREAVESAHATLDIHNHVMDELENGLLRYGWFSGFDVNNDLPVKFSLDEWIALARDTQAIVFIAVHGDIGEDGTLQSLLESSRVFYTGPGVVASNTCMDKVSTSISLKQLTACGILTVPKDVWSRQKLIGEDVQDIWHHLTGVLDSKTLCVKPTRDGCSTGVARLCTVDDLSIYVKALKGCLKQIPANTLSKEHGIIEMPNLSPESLLFEPFIETDAIFTSSKGTNSNACKLVCQGQVEWVEITVGVMGKRGAMRSLTPSISVKERGDILSLEEKFQGGTGINLTPPPVAIISKEALKRCKQRIEKIADALELEGFSRIDAFVNVRSGEVIVIEVNTVPAMTPSTVLIHQALAEEPPMYPRTFFRAVLDLALEREHQVRE